MAIRRPELRSKAIALIHSNIGCAGKIRHLKNSLERILLVINTS